VRGLTATRLPSAYPEIAKPWSTPWAEDDRHDYAGSMRHGTRVSNCPHGIPRKNSQELLPDSSSRASRATLSHRAGSRALAFWTTGTSSFGVARHPGRQAPGPVARIIRNVSDPLGQLVKPRGRSSQCSATQTLRTAGVTTAPRVQRSGRPVPWRHAATDGFQTEGPRRVAEDR
jgi:hypothetical protein